MKRILLAMLLCGVALAGNACSDDSGPASTSGPALRLGAELSTAHVRGQAVPKGGSLLEEGVTVDSLQVSKVRFLVRELKLNRAGAEGEGSDKKIRVGPFVVTATSTGTTVVLVEPVPVGTYEQIKFEFHRFHSSEVAQYINDPVFGDFAADDRYSFIIDGVVYKDGVETSFVYRSTLTANLKLKFVEALVISQNTTAEAVLRVDVPAVFVREGAVLDPRDARNHDKIDNNIKDAIKAIKKSF